MVRIVPLGVNRYFGEGNNLGAEAATGDFLVFLNNDAFVHPGWIESLASAMEDDPGVAAVGPNVPLPRWSDPGGRRGIVLPNGEVARSARGRRGFPITTPNRAMSTSARPPACSCVRGNFLSVGGFGFEYEPAYYEDVDLCLKLALHFGRVIVDPRARVTHIESHTTTDRALQLHDMVELNRHKFANVWGDWLDRRQAFGTAAADTSEQPTVPWGTGLLPSPAPASRKDGADGGALLPLRAGAGWR